ncbi:MAG: right-handed parallel beta-helix repeat-containing protein [Saprospiraceae bacterium]
MINPLKGKISIHLVIICFFSMLFWCLGCYKEQFTSNSADKLRFSVDTLRFDTVFTTVGSATRSFKIYNDASLPLKISSIKIKKVSASVFRLNVDGFAAASLELHDIEIGARDSIYVFLEVTVNPNQPLSISPFVIDDEIEFVTNGNNQMVHLEAWGQNANYIPNRNAKGGLALLTCNLQDETWSDPKPYVIYGVLLIDSCTLHIPAGARVYVHGGIARAGQARYNDGIIYVLQHGRLLVEGTADNKVYFAHDRLESELKDDYGGWAGIRFGPGSVSNRISYAEIKSPIVGVYADSASDVTIRNTIIYNSAGAGILGVHARIIAENCLFYSNGTHSIQFAYGGNYRVDYCTMANYDNEAEALSLDNVLVRDPDNNLVSYNPLNATITNSIITGNGKDELGLIDGQSSNPDFFKISFSNSYIKAEELLTPKSYPDFFKQCPGCIRAKINDTLFLSPSKYDYRLDSNSIANNKAKYIDRIPIDILGIFRDKDLPDMGCYELK